MAAQEAAAGASVFRRQGGTGTRRAQGRHYLAHPGQRQEHCHGIAGQVDTGKQPTCPCSHITDRDELDTQIEGVFTEAGETIKRTSSGRDLMRQLGQAKPRLLCSFVHKFGRKDVKDIDAFIRELEAQPSKTVGEVFVFVDECHRTQNGKLHRVMKAMMPNAIFIGFTGTPLFKKDKRPVWKCSAAISTPTSSAKQWKTRWCSI